MFLFVNLCLSGNNGTGGSFSIQMPTSSSSVWSSATAHVGRGMEKRRVRMGVEIGGSSSSADKPTCKQMNHISKGIKAAFGVFQGWKVVQKLQVASPEASASNWVVLSVKATKLFAKGLKVSQKVLTSAHFSKLVFKGRPAGATAFKDLASLAKGLNAFYAAIKVVQFMKGLGRQPQEGKLHDEDSIWKGYKFSKSLVNILDPVVGKSGWAFAHAEEGFLVLKNTVGSIGVVVKAALLSKEVCIAVLEKLAISGASLQTGYKRNHIGMLVDRSYQSKPKRLLCAAITKYSDFRNLLLASFPYVSLSNDGLFSVICLFKCFTEDMGSPFITFCEDDDQSIIFYLAIPLPSTEILV